ncbi:MULTISPECIES: SDR family oxidoreductase [Rhodobacterales]|uniref:SDR family oxidoreductase n=1 Tax=Halocynthiibacter styelae TaxID=2761955 RepID=A0A8J7IDU2_9RHOB|nr:MULTISPECIES: SDR family oxidoreductase [Rhodobacterales]MBI1494758.1 SDR family oxidoreductase [Paenihalocynthiibacter styelae]
MTTVSGKTVFITGASRGIGEAAARLFADQGAKVVLFARSGDAVNAIAADIGENALALTGDVSSWPDMVNAITHAERHFGPIDILINNAGVIDPIGMLNTSDPEAWGKAIDINTKGVYYGMRAVVPGMESRGRGTVITISSGAAHNALEGWSAYCTSKAGTAMLTRAAHLESGGKGVRIMGLSPGTVATQMQKDIKVSGINAVSQLEWEDHVPADWPAKVLLWMCSDDARDWWGAEVSLRDEGIRRAAGLIE